MIDKDLSVALSIIEDELNKRWGEHQIDPSLERIVALLDLLGNPQHSYPAIHIAGTNGKTSTSRMIDSLLSGFALRTGRFTSPHLQSVTERICIDNEPIDPQLYVDVYNEVLPYVEIVDGMFEPVRLSKFEVLTAMAFVAFSQAPVDVAVIEVGLGGRWDSTNVINSKIAVITPISVDHTEYLGDTIEKIAQEKAGIIKNRLADKAHVDAYIDSLGSSLHPNIPLSSVYEENIAGKDITWFGSVADIRKELIALRDAADGAVIEADIVRIMQQSFLGMPGFPPYDNEGSTEEDNAQDTSETPVSSVPTEPTPEPDHIHIPISSQDPDPPGQWNPTDDQVVIVARQDSTAMRAIVEATEAHSAVIAREDSEFMVLERHKAVHGQMVKLQGLGGVYDEIFLPLFGQHQAHNAVLALSAVEAFFGAGISRQLNVDTVREAFAHVQSPGRLEPIASRPTVLIDAAHNPHGVDALAQALNSEFDFTYIVGVVSILGEKDMRGILNALEPVCHEIIITHNGSPRAVDIETLASAAETVFGIERVHTNDTVIGAVAQAVDLVNSKTIHDKKTGNNSGGGIIVTGSVVTAGKAREALYIEPQ